MSLEQHIQELTAAVLELTDVVKGSAASPPSAPAQPAKDTPTPAPAKRTAAPPVEEPRDQASPLEVELQPESPAAPTLAYADLMKALTELGKHLQAAGQDAKAIRAAGIACLNRVGAATLPEIKDKPETWPLLIEAIERVKAGGEA